MCGNPSQRISSIISTETIILKTKNLKTINTSSDRLVTTFNTPSPLKDRTRSNLHDDIGLHDKIEYISSVATTIVNVISVAPKIWRPNPKHNYKQTFRTDVDEDLYVYKHCGNSINISSS